MFIFLLRFDSIHFECLSDALFLALFILAYEYKKPPHILMPMKNQVFSLMTLSKSMYPKKVTGILLRDPKMAYVVGPVAWTQLRLAKFRKKPTNPAQKFFKK
mmetsp:Transcript_3778/g.5451  ORF Transcript_3778/g.5451 Transcript_3778/m.5451 type:complete len:102 (+) Transcript_3778:82-387(+)